MSDPSTAPQERDQPGRLLLTGYAAEQVLWMVPLILGLVLFVVGGLLVIVWVGIIFVVAAVPLIRVIANRQRHIAGRVLGADLPPPYRPSPDGGPLIQLRTVLTDPMTWRDLAWILWAITFGWVISLLVIILLLALVTFFFWWFGAYPLLWMRSQVDRVLLTYGNTETLERRVEALTRSRAAAVDHSAAELRRLERDLHDG
ncbi:MAG TPA: sensor domain-containing protein, partial [Nocardioides sp.]|nr:sensor domain-containing protein [Nocardioides sp.]